MRDRLVVSAPASSANLGPGFDCLAVALDIRNEVEILTAIRGGGIEIQGEGAGRPFGEEDNLFLRAFRRGGGDPAGLRIRMTNRVPFARGLGSSAAAIAAGLVAAHEWTGTEGDLLADAVELEGHPDNVAAALNGGVTLAWMRADGPAAVGLGDPPFGLVVVIPGQELSTAEARAVLPSEVPRADAVHTAARAALLVAALGAGDPDLLAEALDDRLHEPYRAPLVPLLAAVRERLPTVPGALGVTISGAGPSVLVWCEAGAEKGAADALDLQGADVRPVAIAERGASAG
jgi:homoserine kinase